MKKIAIFIALIMFVSAFSALGNIFSASKINLKSAKTNSNLSQPIYVTLEESVSGTFRGENDEKWYEYSVSPGIYKVSVEVVNKKNDGCSLSIDIYEKVEEFSPEVGKNVTYWSQKYGSYEYLSPGEIYHWERHLYIINDGEIAVNIHSYYSDLDVHYTINVKKIVDFADIGTISNSESSNVPAESKYKAYKFSGHGVCKCNINATVYHTNRSYYFVYPYLSYSWSDLEYGESLEIYWNGTKVGTISPVGIDIQKIENPDPGYYEVKIKYKNTTKSDGVDVNKLYIAYMCDGSTSIDKDSYSIYTHLSYTNNETIVGVTLPQIASTNSLDVDIINADYGYVAGSFYLWDNMTDEDYFLLNSTYYVILEKDYSATKVDFDIKFESADYESLLPGEKITINFDDPDKTVPVLIHLEENYYYDLSMEITNDAKWYIYLTAGFSSLAYVNNAFNSSLNSTKLLYITSIQAYYKSPTYMSCDIYNYMWIGKTYQDEAFETAMLGVDYSCHPVLFALLSGFNYTNISAVVDISLDEIEPIGWIGSEGVKADISSDENLYEVYRFNVTMFNLYRIEIGIDSINNPGKISGFVYMYNACVGIEGFDLDKALDIYSTTDGPMIFEYVSSYSGVAYITIEAYSGFDGTIVVNLEETKPESLPMEVTIGQDNTVFVGKISIIRGHTYRFKITKDQSVTLYVYMADEKGMSPLPYSLDGSRTYLFCSMIRPETSMETSVTFDYEGIVYIILDGYGSGNITIEYEDITPQPPITQNMMIWLPIGIVVGLLVGIIVVKALKKE
ncbi:MAG: hypothetical protein Q6363_002645 [Candidatus Njordarchaeota archaeon]